MTFTLAFVANAQPSTAGSPYTVVARGPDDRLWVSVGWQTNSAGQAVTTTNSSFVEVASGLHFLKDGQWQASQDLIELMPDGGAAAVHGPCKAYFSPNLNKGALTFVTASNRVFKTQPVGLFYYDAASGKAVRLALLRDCAGELLPPNQVVYKSIFDSIQADLRLNYTKAAIESDLVLLQRPKPPEAYGLNPQTTRLELWHAWLDAPTPRQKPIVLKPDFIDTILDFGDLWFPRGRAFA